MAVHDWASSPVASTAAASADPSTATLIAELTPDNLAPVLGSTAALVAHAPSRLVDVIWTVAASTVAEWQLEHCLSTGLGSTAIRDRLTVRTVTNETVQMVQRYVMVPGDRLRARIASTFTGNVAVKILAEALS